MGLDKCIITHIHHYGTMQSAFTAIKTVYALLIYPSSAQLLAVFTVPKALPFPEYHVVGIMQYVAFSDRLLSLSNMHLKFLHVYSWLDSSFLFSTE